MSVRLGLSDIRALFAAFCAAFCMSSAAEEESLAKDEFGDSAATLAQIIGDGSWEMPEEGDEDSIPSFNEMAEITSMMPKLPRIEAARLEVVDDALNEKLLNAATRRAVVINVKEQLKTLIGDMSDEEEEEYEKSWEAALDFPCEEVTDWLKAASPIIGELVKLKAIVDADFIKFDELLAEANMLRLNRLYAQSHETMREAIYTASEMKAAKERMQELQKQMSALGPMPDPKEKRNEVAKRFKESKEAVKEYLMGETNPEIGGEYEAVERVVTKGQVWDDYTLQTAFEVEEGEGTPFWRREKIYIEPIIKYPETGVVLLYANIYDNASLNTLYAIETPEGGLDIFVSDTVKVTITPEKDNIGRDVLVARSVCVGGSVFGTFTTVYKPNGVRLERFLPGATQNDVADLERLKKKAKPDYMAKIHQDNARELVEKFRKNAEGKTLEFAPKEEDLYYVLVGMEPLEDSSVSTQRVYEASVQYVKDDHYSQVIKQLEAEKGYVSSPQAVYDDVLQSAMFRADLKRIADIFCVSKNGRKFALDSGSAELHARWTPPQTLVKAENPKIEFSYWIDLELKEPKHSGFGEYWGDIRAYSSSPVAEGLHVPDSKANYHTNEIARASGKVTVEKWILQDHQDMKAQFDAYPEIDVLFEIPGFGGKYNIGIMFRYKRMILTPDEAERIAAESNMQFRDILKSEWDSKAFADIAVEMDEYVSKLKEKEEETVSLAERIEFHQENIRYIKESMEWLQKKLDEEKAQYTRQGERYNELAQDPARREAKMRAAEENADLKGREYKALLATSLEQAGKELFGVKALGDAETPELRIAQRDAELNKAEHEYELARAYAERLKKDSGMPSWERELGMEEAKKEYDESVGRYEQMAYTLIGMQDELVRENDLMAGEQTGVYHRSRSQFDELCSKKNVETSLKMAEAGKRVKRLQEDTRRAIIRLAEQDEAKSRGAYLRLAKYKEEKAAVSAYEKAVKLYGQMPPANAASEKEWREFAKKIQGINLANAENAQAIAIEEEINASERLYNAEVTKAGASVLLFIGTLGASSPEGAVMMKDLMLLNTVAGGYSEKGPQGAVENYVRFYSYPVDLAMGAVEGYQSGGLKGMALQMGAAVGFHIGIPWARKHIDFNKDIRVLYKEGKAAAQGGFDKLKLFMKGKNFKSAKAEGPSEEELEYARFRKEGRELVKDFKKKYDKIQNLDETKMTDEEIGKLRAELVEATAKINEHPEAKLILKNDPRMQVVAQQFNGQLKRIYGVTKVRYYKEMNAKGYEFHKIKSIRNDKSGKSTGMDADFALVDESVEITRNGKKVSLLEFQQDANECLAKAYKKTTGHDTNMAWMQVTTSKHSEAYRSKAILGDTSKRDIMREILNTTSRADAEQMMDVTLFKASEMMSNKKFPKLAMVLEACRGTAKDMSTKLFPAIDTRLDDLRIKMSRPGYKFNAADEREVARLTKAKENFMKVYTVYDKIARHKIEPPKWREEIKLATDDEGILESITRMNAFMQSLVIKK